MRGEKGSGVGSMFLAGGEMRKRRRDANGQGRIGGTKEGEGKRGEWGREGEGRGKGTERGGGTCLVVEGS